MGSRERWDMNHHDTVLTIVVRQRRCGRRRARASIRPRCRDGSLPRTVFAGYLAQDAFFLESFARAYALALARSPDTSTLLTLADLLTGVRQELGLHASYAGSWGIDMAGVEPLPATLAYTEFLLATAARSGARRDFAAMTPCMRLYAWLGASLDAANAGPYASG